jgi:hypothetical protein
MAQANATETTKIPLYYEQKDKDTLQPNTWLDWCEQAVIVHGWNDAQKIFRIKN